MTSITTHQPIVLRCKRERQEKRWPNTEDIIIENEREQKKHEGATATVVTEDRLGY